MRLAIAVGMLAACTGGGDGLDDTDLELGGDTTIDDRTIDAFTHPAQNLATSDAATFQAGRGPFDFQWEIPQLGPLFNNNACLGCHNSDGRGLSQIGNQTLVSQGLVRVSLVDGTPDVPGGDVPVPSFGLQLQDHATVGLPEVTVTQAWNETATIALAGGEIAMLRTPQVVPHTPDGQTLDPSIRMSYRQAPGLIGLGLLEAVPADAVMALADPDDADGDGISGRANLVWDATQNAMALGRFGHKATVATLREQVAGAFSIDMGLSNEMFPETDGERDVADSQFEQVVFFVSTIGVPAAAPRNAAAQRGRDQFTKLGCASCHVPTLVTGDHAIPAVAHQTIHPYTDLLLHDLGDLLTDARRDFTAEGTEWRTPPLWGLGLVQQVAPGATFMHDGRARTLTEAIVWHGGEAAAASLAFQRSPKQQRDDLIAFLQTL